MSKNLHISALLDVYGAFLGDKQGVRDQIKRAEQTLFSLEEKCGYCRRFLRLKELSELAKAGDGAAIKEITDIIEEL